MIRLFLFLIMGLLSLSALIVFWVTDLKDDESIYGKIVTSVFTAGVAIVSFMEVFA